MKTLDEVIKAIEVCRDSYVAGKIIKSDALHYLKEYQKDKQIYSYDIARRNLELAYRNDPLSWDELKQMEGKPVWVEEKDMPSTWIIIWDVTENWLYPTGCDAYRHEEYGKTWQAYRKER